MKKQFTILLFLISFSISFTKAQSNFVGSGIALQFNGNGGNGIDLGDVYNTLTFPFTIEMWINLQAYPSHAAGLTGIDNDLTAYYGIYLSINPGGVVIMEFGNGGGSGQQNRRGFQTTTALPLNRWIHLAATSSSVTDMHFYFNGVEQTKVPSSGTSTSTTITHSAAHASIGRTIDNAFEFDLHGILDEVRLWTTQRSQTDIRDFMCKKLDPGTTGLIGYWTADESYTSSTLNDNTLPAEHGTIVGTVGKITSGAPIGDESQYNYTSTWSGVTISETDLSGDQFTVSNITGNPLGVQTYLVKSLPYDIGGLDITPSFYFGVFCAYTSTIPQYDVTYNYDFGDGTISSNNESTASLFKRGDGSVTTWTNASGMLDTGTNSISKNSESTRAEYILDVTEAPCICSSPVITSIDSICGNIASICWSPVECATEYIIRWNTLPALTWIYETITAPDTCMQFTSKYGQTNQIQLASVCESGDTSDFSDVYTYTGYLVCDAPTGLTATNFTSSSAILSWAANPDASKYKVLYRHAGVINTLTTSNTSVTISGLQPHASYKWKVKARCTYCDHKNWGPYSDFQNFTTLSERQFLLGELESSMVVYPNPANDIFWINFNAGYSTNESYSMEVQNIFGQVIMSDKGYLSGGNITREVSLDNEITDGLYFVVITIKGKEYRKQLVISKD